MSIASNIAKLCRLLTADGKLTASNITGTLTANVQQAATTTLASSVLSGSITSDNIALNTIPLSFGATDLLNLYSNYVLVQVNNNAWIPGKVYYINNTFVRLLGFATLSVSSNVCVLGIIEQGL